MNNVIAKGAGSREQGVGKRQEARGKRQEVKNLVYLIAVINAIKKLGRYPLTSKTLLESTSAYPLPPTPYTLHPTPYSLLPTPYSLKP